MQTASPQESNGAVAHVELIDVGKSYGGVRALHGITLQIARGEVHALVGENGAGKSTVGKIIGGAETYDTGRLRVANRDVSYRSPREALGAGIALVHQEIAVARGLSVLENALLGVESTRFGMNRRRHERKRFRAIADDLGFDVDPDAPAADLRVADQQKVEIMRALARDGDLIVLDEPTAALTSQEAAQLQVTIRRLRDRGITFVYISHDLQEVLRIADRVSVMKDGRLVSTSDAAQESVGSLIHKMLGRSLDALFPDKRGPAPDATVVLRVHGLSRPGALSDISFQAKAGEIVGIAGLVGSGRTELARAIFGADPVSDGQIEVDGSPVSIPSPRHAVRHGVAMLPESRKDQGLIMLESIGDNLALPFIADFTRFGFRRTRSERNYAEHLVERLDIRPARLSTPVINLSGGNQQKVALGKWLGHLPSVLIVDEPTRGVDVGARAKIYEILCELADEGVAVLLISSELEEVMGLAHTILVMHRGRLVRVLPGEAEEQQILAASFGEDHQ